MDVITSTDKMLTQHKTSLKRSSEDLIKKCEAKNSMEEEYA